MLISFSTGLLQYNYYQGQTFQYLFNTSIANLLMWSAFSSSQGFCLNLMTWTVSKTEDIKYVMRNIKKPAEDIIFSDKEG